MSDGQSHLIIPKWFLTIFSIGMTLATITFVPWVVWQTRVTLRLEIQIEAVKTLTSAVELIKAEQIKRTGNVYKLGSIEEDLARLRSRLDRLEARP